MKKTKFEKGITLIALIITIVVLLILAVVTIGAIRESSIITHAQNAKESWEDGATEEEIELKLAELKMDMATNSDKYEFIVSQDGDDIYKENDILITEDDGSLKKIFNSIDLTIVGSQLNEGKFKFNYEIMMASMTIMDKTESMICNYNILCINKNNKEIIVNIRFTMCEDSVNENKYICSITQINLLSGFDKTIATLNDKLNNRKNYTITQTADIENEEMQTKVSKLLYDTLVNEGISIASDELLNSEKNSFEYEKICTKENVAGQGYNIDINCTIGTETKKITARLGLDRNEEKQTIVYIPAIWVK